MQSKLLSNDNNNNSETRKTSAVDAGAMRATPHKDKH